MPNLLKKNNQAKYRKVLLACIIPIPVVFAYAYYTSIKSIHHQLQTIASSYTLRIDDLISTLHDENVNVLVNGQSCQQIQQQLLFESLLREMLIVENQHIVCSSKRGELLTDISRYYPDGKIQNKIRFFDLNDDASMRTLLVINTDKKHPYRGAISVIDQHYIQDRLGYHTDNRIAKLVIKVDNKYYPATEQFHHKRHQALVTSDREKFQLQVIASDDFVKEQVLLYLLSALPASIALSLSIYGLFIFFRGRTSLLDDLKKGLERQELFLVYQPIINSQTQQTVSYEALLRWVNPKLGFVKPDTFILIAEQYGLINKVTDYVIEQVQQNVVHFPHDQSIHLSLNIPPCYLAEKQHINRLILCASKLGYYGIQLVVEITERQLLDEQGQNILGELRKAGILIAIDDFGTGHTALSVLQNITFDYLKIDKCFIDSIGMQSVNAPVLNTIIELAHQLNVSIVAEGVENAIQAQYLKDKGVQCQQGYYYSKPLDITQVENYFQSSLDQYLAMTYSASG